MLLSSAAIHHKHQSAPEQHSHIHVAGAPQRPARACALARSSRPVRAQPDLTHAPLILLPLQAKQRPSPHWLMQMLLSPHWLIQMLLSPHWLSAKCFLLIGWCNNALSTSINLLSINTLSFFIGWQPCLPKHWLFSEFLALIGTYVQFYSIIAVCSWACRAMGKI